MQSKCVHPQHTRTFRIVQGTQSVDDALFNAKLSSQQALSQNTAMMLNDVSSVKKNKQAKNEFVKEKYLRVYHRK